MSIDRYSENHTIQVDGGTGTLTLDADVSLTNVSAIASATTFDLTSTTGTTITAADIALVASNNIELNSTAATTITSGTNFVVAANGYVEIQSNADNAAANATLTLYNTGAATLVTDSIARISADGNATLESILAATTVESATTMTIDAGTTSDISSGTAMTITAGTTLDVTVGGAMTVGCDTLTITGDAAGSVGQIINSNADPSADLLLLDFSAVVTPNGGNNWIAFRSSGNTIRGQIQGASNSYGGYYAIVSSEVVGTDQYALNGTGGGAALATLAGYVQYTSGSSDFGEWLPLGDYSEWQISQKEQMLYSKTKVFPIEEGSIIYVRDSKIWKKGPGRAMVITHRAALVGNQKYVGNVLGAIVSFSGQVPTYVKGPVSDGDILVALNGDNYATPISPDVISMKDYIAAIGTAWKTDNQTGLFKINCAIGVK